MDFSYHMNEIYIYSNTVREKITMNGSESKKNWDRWVSVLQWSFFTGGYAEFRMGKINTYTGRINNHIKPSVKSYDGHPARVICFAARQSFREIRGYD